MAENETVVIMSKQNNQEECWWYRLIDDNWTRKPKAFCIRYDGYLTNGLMNTHGCKKRNCIRLKTVEYGIEKEEKTNRKE